MSNEGELLQIEPVELQFPFELKKQISCSMQLTNKSDNYVAFKVKTTNPKKYCVRPNTGIVMPHSASEVIVTMQAQKEAPPDMQCKDKFLLQSVVASPGATAKDITPEMFNKESGNYVEDCKLKVVYVPPQLPSPVREGSEEGSSPRASVFENGAVNTSEFNTISRVYNEQQDSSSEADPTLFGCGCGICTGSGQPNLGALTIPIANKYRLIGHLTKALISKLTEEKISVMQQNNKLQQELELLRRERSRSRGGIPTRYVLIIALLGILLGYLLKKT
ncbi:hypothetical protein RND71_035068 [Anisodus tanguticus]|uniref:MSP domain-containing protein n=1 Tax=Anisodus tanguticus TaxID=243964 RepID=A0AAE1R6G4_9SOLA|nr:hypothetical protein RND71_035068 [Anisodus tanguticus]